MPATPEERGPFLHRLESVRGIAALMVAGSHSISVLSSAGVSARAIRFLSIPLNGHAAVVLFFVLSGLVLAMSLARGPSPFALNYALFAVRRVLRIWPAFFAGSLVIAGVILTLDKPMVYPKGVSAWFAWHWGMPIDGWLVLKNLGFADQRLNPPSWTLQTEIVCSMALPALFWAWARLKGRGRAGVLALLLGLSVVSQLNPARYLFMFYTGLLIAQHGRGIMGWVNRAGALRRLAGPVSLLLLCSGRFWHGHGSHSLPWALAADGLVAGLFVVVLLHGPEERWNRVLDWPVSRFFGRISYSFYIYHMVVLYLIAKCVIQRASPSALASHTLAWCGLFFVVSTAVATLVAWVSYRLVELPCIELSKSWCRRLARFAGPRLCAPPPGQGCVRL